MREPIEAPVDLHPADVIAVMAAILYAERPEVSLDTAIGAAASLYYEVQVYPLSQLGLRERFVAKQEYGETVHD